MRTLLGDDLIALSVVGRDAALLIMDPDCAKTRRWLMPRLGMHGMRAVLVAEGYRRHWATDRAPFAAAAGQEGNIFALDQACTAPISPWTPTRFIARLRL